MKQREEAPCPASLPYLMLLNNVLYDLLHLGHCKLSARNCTTQVCFACGLSLAMWYWLMTWDDVSLNQSVNRVTV